MTAQDPSNGYDAVAEDYIRARSDAGAALVSAWAANLPVGASVLDLGCGHGDPNMPVLLKAGLEVAAIDASPSLLAAFQERYPCVEIACEPVQDSRFFERQFDAILAVGLIFLLPENEQLSLIDKMSAALSSQGQVLFSAPLEQGSWEDLLTTRRSISLGERAYKAALKDAGFVEIDSLTDQGGSHYYSARKA